MNALEISNSAQRNHLHLAIFPGTPPVHSTVVVDEDILYSERRCSRANQSMHLKGTQRMDDLKETARTEDSVKGSS